MRERFAAISGVGVPASVRAVLLLLCSGVATTTDRPVVALAWLLPLGAVAVLATRPGSVPAHLLWLIGVEGLVAGMAVAGTGASDSPYLPYLIAPAFAGGLRRGLLGGILPLGTAASALLVAPFVSDERVTTYASSSTAQWVVLALLVGLVASWVRAVVREGAEDPGAAQREAFRLLTELRDVARHLPGTLDPATTGEAMLQRAREHVRYDSGAVLVGVSGDRQLTVLVRVGQGRPRWDLSLRSEGPLAEVWLSQHGRRLGHRLSTTDSSSITGSALIVPLVAGARTLGLMVLESGVASAFPDSSVPELEAAVRDLVLQLQTGLVFADVRELATHEERRRLAREIHDGIAQELASVAYALDTVAVELDDPQTVSNQIELIRQEVRRLITELRMSLFDLRSDVAPDEGLGAAIGRHVHQVGTASGLTVHLSLNEAPVRLPADTEAELLRIVQEAVANARKHARAENLWVFCTIDPPNAVITIEDDGTGVAAEPGAGSHGLAIMNERAERIHAHLRVEPREPRGTRVRLTLDRLVT